MITVNGLSYRYWTGQRHVYRKLTSNIKTDGVARAYSRIGTYIKLCDLYTVSSTVGYGP